MSLFKTAESFREDAQEAFKLFSSVAQNEIPASELPSVLRCLGFEPNSEIEKVIAAESVAEESGVVPVSIFSSIINGLGEEACPGPQAEDVIEAFRQFDRESNGFITASEVRHLLSGLEEELEDTKIQDLIHDRLLDGDGQLNYHEFVDILSNAIQVTPQVPADVSMEEADIEA